MWKLFKVKLETLPNNNHNKLVTNCIHVYDYIIELSYIFFLYKHFFHLIPLYSICILFCHIFLAASAFPSFSDPTATRSAQQQQQALYQTVPFVNVSYQNMSMDKIRMAPHPIYYAPQPYLDPHGQNVGFSNPAQLNVLPGIESKTRLKSLECRHWTRGYCALMNNCNFRHSRGVNAQGEMVQPKPRSNAICRNWAKGYCSQSPCKFAHTSTPGSGFGPTSERKSEAPCRHYAKGFCERGDACGFSHSANVEQNVQAPQPQQNLASTDELQQQPPQIPHQAQVQQQQGSSNQQQVVNHAANSVAELVDATGSLSIQ